MGALVPERLEQFSNVLGTKLKLIREHFLCRASVTKKGNLRDILHALDKRMLSCIPCSLFCFVLGRFHLRLKSVKFVAIKHSVDICLRLGKKHTLACQAKPVELVEDLV